MDFPRTLVPHARSPRLGFCFSRSIAIGVIFALLFNITGSLANAHPLVASDDGVEVSRQTVFGNNGNLGPAEAVPIAKEDGIAEGPIPFSAPVANGMEKTVVNTLNYPSWYTSTLLARRLLALSNTATLSSVYPKAEESNLSGIPIGLPEYIADCDDKFPDVTGGEGNPTILGLRIGTTFRNIAAGSNLSLSVDWWGRDPKNSDVSPASLPRLTLLGYLEEIPTPPASSPSSYSELETCFLSAHPDARYWLPNRDGAVHDGFWARMVVQEAFWIGGFGDVARIGWFNVTEWKGIRENGSVDGVGDGSGRGWGDVRLPGEE